MTDRTYELEGGKYEITEVDGGLTARRYGEPWRDLTGDKMILALLDKIDAERAKTATLESLRPHWAQGHTSDSVAAQCATSALANIWSMLAVDSQTDAMSAIRKMIAEGEAA